MGDWYEHFQDFPEENPANYLNGRFDPEGVRRERERLEKLERDQARLDASIATMIRDAQERGRANRNAERALEENSPLSQAYVDEIWARISAVAGQPFTTFTGKHFTYSVAGTELTTSRTPLGISQADFMRALRVVPIESPSEIVEHVRNAAYVWAILHDARVRQQEW